MVRAHLYPTISFFIQVQPLLDNVVSHKEFPTPLQPALQKVINRPTTKTAEYEQEREIWKEHWELNLRFRKDPDPCKEQLSSEEIKFGLSDEQIQKYLAPVSWASIALVRLNRILSIC